MKQPQSAIAIAFLESSDRSSWEILARGYRDFYGTPTSDEEIGTAWQKLDVHDEIFGLTAKIDGEMVGIAHFLFHCAVWTPRYCYLQDLFTAPEARGRGVARALIDAVAVHAKHNGAVRYYWQTQADNKTARILYDKVAQHKGFIRYEYSLDDT